MDFTKIIRQRKLPFELEFLFGVADLICPELNFRIQIPEGWSIPDNAVFSIFKRDYKLSVFEDVSDKEVSQIKKALFPPYFIFSKPTSLLSSDKYIVGYVYDHEILKGGANLHLRSLAKYEQMWASYILEKTSGRQTEIKALLINGNQGTLSNEIFFNSGFKDEEIQNNRLRILMINYDVAILTLYFLYNDLNPISDEEIDLIIGGIKQLP